MKLHVLTISTSASSARGVSSYPRRLRRPIITSLSTRFLGHPRLKKPTLGAIFGVILGSVFGMFAGFDTECRVAILAYAAGCLLRHRFRRALRLVYCGPSILAYYGAYRRLRSANSTFPSSSANRCASAPPSV